MWYAPEGSTVFFSPAELVALLKKRFVWLGINTALFRRDALLEAGGLDPALRWHSDWFATYSIALRHGFCAVPQSLARFRLSPHSYSAIGMRDRRAQRGGQPEQDRVLPGAVVEGLEEARLSRHPPAPFVAAPRP